MSRSRDAQEAVAVLERLGLRPAEADLTVVQFSTAFCGPCRATRARVRRLQDARPWLAYLQVDAESQLDAVRALRVERTPALFYVDRRGALIARGDGAPSLAELTAVVDGPSGAGARSATLES